MTYVVGPVEEYPALSDAQIVYGPDVTVEGDNYVLANPPDDAVVEAVDPEPVPEPNPEPNPIPPAVNPFPPAPQ